MVKRNYAAMARMDTERCFYTIVGQESFRPNSNYQISISVHDLDNKLVEQCNIKIGIEMENGEVYLNTERNVIVKPNTTELLTIPIGDLELERVYKLVAKGLSGINFEHEAKLNIQSKKVAILIQTDKAIYKPSDCVRFRVLVLDSELRPASINDGDMQVFIVVSAFWTHFVGPLITLKKIYCLGFLPKSH